jgi:hypothetical protein
MDDPAFEAARRRAEELAALFAGVQAVTEAELAARPASTRSRSPTATRRTTKTPS